MTYTPVSLSAIPQFLDALCAYFTVLLFFSSIVLVPVMGTIFALRYLLRNRHAYWKGLSWMILPLAVCAGKLKAYFEFPPFMRVFLRLQQMVFLYRPLRVGICAGAVLFLAHMVFQYVRLYRFAHSLPVRTVCGVQVRLAPKDVPSFACGLLSPLIVLPEDAKEVYSQAQLHMILTHEQMHIKFLHLWFLSGLDLLCALFFFHPLVWIGRKAFAQDMEEVADAACMQSLSVDADAYGSLLLKVAAMRREVPCAAPGISIAGNASFSGLKARILRIAGYRKLSKRLAAAVTAAALFLCVSTGVLLHAHSLPSYTVLKSVSVLREDFETLYLEESPELQASFSYDDRMVTVDVDAFRKLLAVNGWEEDAFWLYFDGYYKLPGIGGGGQVVWADLKEADADGVLRLEYEATTDILNEVFKRL